MANVDKENNQLEWEGVAYARLEFIGYKIKDDDLLFFIGPADDHNGACKSKLIPARETVRSPMREKFSLRDLALMNERVAALITSGWLEDRRRESAEFRAHGQ